ncbi:hypothetical protein G3I22_17615, partial [Actinospica acidiphila]|nr:hypothetical protein [Actinospica acidiphila]
MRRLYVPVRLAATVVAVAAAAGCVSVGDDDAGGKAAPSHSAGRSGGEAPDGGTDRVGGKAGHGAAGADGGRDEKDGKDEDGKDGKKKRKGERPSPSGDRPSA